MLVVGGETIYLSHLPMFLSPHDSQVILEATFMQAGSDVQGAYVHDRKQPSTKISYGRTRTLCSSRHHFKGPTTATSPDEERDQGVQVIFPGSANAIADRLLEQQQVPGGICSPQEIMDLIG